MKASLAAFWAETLKARRSKASLLTVIVFVLFPLVSGLFMVILKDPQAAQSMGLISVKAQLVAGTADWPTFFDMLLQAMAMGGSILFAFIMAWVFGREFSDRTAKELLALPTPRASHRRRQVRIDSPLDLGTHPHGLPGRAWCGSGCRYSRLVTRFGMVIVLVPPDHRRADICAHALCRVVCQRGTRLSASAWLGLFLIHPRPDRQRVGLGGLVSMVCAGAAEWHVRAASRRADWRAQLHPGDPGFYHRDCCDIRLVAESRSSALAIIGIREAAMIFDRMAGALKQTVVAFLFA